MDQEEALRRLPSQLCRRGRCCVGGALPVERGQGGGGVRELPDGYGKLRVPVPIHGGFRTLQTELGPNSLVGENCFGNGAAMGIADSVGQNGGGERRKKNGCEEKLHLSIRHREEGFGFRPRRRSYCMMIGSDSL